MPLRVSPLITCHSSLGLVNRFLTLSIKFMSVDFGFRLLIWLFGNRPWGIWHGTPGPISKIEQFFRNSEGTSYFL
jgi:hypothetical protein